MNKRTGVNLYGILSFGIGFLIGLAMGVLFLR